MKIASAQISAKVGDIEGNLEKHYEFIAAAHRQKVNLILFPEMSITGYCREEGRTLAFKKDDERLGHLQHLSKSFGLTIIAGAPIASGNQLHIGAFVIKPNGAVEIYTKQYLHDGEEEYYDSSFDHDPIIELEGERIFLAICADIENEKHPQRASARDCTIYAASIFYSKQGIEKVIELDLNDQEKALLEVSRGHVQEVMKVLDNMA